MCVRSRRKPSLLPISCSVSPKHSLTHALRKFSAQKVIFRDLRSDSERRKRFCFLDDCPMSGLGLGASRSRKKGLEAPWQALSKDPRLRSSIASQQKSIHTSYRESSLSPSNMKIARPSILVALFEPTHPCPKDDDIAEELIEKSNRDARRSGLRKGSNKECKNGKYVPVSFDATKVHGLMP